MGNSAAAEGLEGVETGLAKGDTGSRRRVPLWRHLYVWQPLRALELERPTIPGQHLVEATTPTLPRNYTGGACVLVFVVVVVVEEEEDDVVVVNFCFGLSVYNIHDTMSDHGATHLLNRTKTPVFQTTFFLTGPCQCG